MEMHYNKIKSEFVRKELKKTVWKNHKYIDDLMDIEGFVFGEHWGISSNSLCIYLKDKYPRQWQAIWMELDPDCYKVEKKAEEKEKQEYEKEERKRKKKEIAEQKQRKKEWMNAGGKDKT